MSLKQRALGNLFSFLRVYFWSLLFFGFFRVLLLWHNFHLVEHVHGKGSLLLQAFFIGLRFDTVISCYILALPILVFSTLFLLGMLTRTAVRAGYIYLTVLFTIAFLACSTDIPFFNHFFSRLNDTLFNWKGHAAFGFKMVAQEPGYYLYFFVFLAVALIFGFLLRRLRRRHELFVSVRGEKIPARNYLVLIPSVLVLLALCFLGIRGRIAEKSPIIPGTAYFCDDPFINQLGLNPVFTLLRSWLDSQNPENNGLHRIDDRIALKTMSDLLKGAPTLPDISPIARRYQQAGVFRNRNVVLVIMESMSAAKMGRYGDPDHLTPFLDSLAAQSWSFDSVFSAGLHTYNGIYTSLFAHPALMKRHTMDHVTVPQMAGFPNVLKEKGYQTIFFTTHDELFDNMSGFLSANGVETVIGEKDYPLAEVKSTLGVPDEFMFRFAVPKLNKLAEKGKPFFAAFMTASDHDPHVIPPTEGFTPPAKAPAQQIVAYADWSIRKFLGYASTQPWYANTVFVFVADHGGIWGENAYDVLFSYHHIPFIVFAPGGTNPRAIPSLGLQSDVFPTVTSLVTTDFVNNTFGIDLLREKHEYIVFSADDKLACMNDSLLSIYRLNGPASLYRYRQNGKEDLNARYPEQADRMHKVAFSWLQTSQWMLEQGRAGLKGK